MRFAFLTGTVLMAATLHAQSAPSAIFADLPADSAHPASLVEIAVPSHGAQLLGAFYLASGAVPHPTAIIYHGFPGYEQNLDLAQALRRAGYNVLAVQTAEGYASRACRKDVGCHLPQTPRVCRVEANLRMLRSPVW